MCPARKERIKMDSGIIELDVHGMNLYQARTAIDARLRRAGAGIYRIRIIHGYRGGTALRTGKKGLFRPPQGAESRTGLESGRNGAGAPGVELKKNIKKRLCGRKGQKKKQPLTVADNPLSHSQGLLL